ncbi:MAG: iron-containing alcohol dehydrogenase [Promethearchaeota archaeon]
MIPPFNFARIPNVIFGPGKLKELFEIIPKFGNNLLFVIGKNSLKASGKWEEILAASNHKSYNYSTVSIAGEPSPDLIDDSSVKFRKKNIDIVISIGGGSVTDAGKAISAMITKKDSIKNYLEGIGSKVHNGEKVPFIAIPTTSGTGSEATKNAVISEIGPNGFKKSLRHENLIPDIAIIDPELMLSCPSSISASCGMDAFTQLLEAYVSPRGNPITDSLAFSGMKFISENILKASSTGSSDVNVRAAMAYGSLLSGITLANAGLGIVHGLASPIGGFFDIPHGVVCGTLLSEATKRNIMKLQKSGVDGRKALRKYAQVGALVTVKPLDKNDDIDKYCSNLIFTLDEWTKQLGLERLGKYGITQDDIDKIVNKTGIKNNPVDLDNEDISTIIINRL